MFKKKKSEILNVIDDSKNPVQNFRLRTSKLGFESYRIAEYRIYHKLEEQEMMPRLEEHLEKLFLGEIDDGNADMLDEILFGAAREALPDLNIQRYEHLDKLRRLIVRRKADREDIQRIIDDRVLECQMIIDEHERTCQMLRKEYQEVSL